MNCPACKTEDYYEGIFEGPNCINPSCVHYKGSKLSIKNKKDSLEASKEDKQYGLSIPTRCVHGYLICDECDLDDDKTLCLFCGKARCRCDVKQKLSSSVSTSSSGSFPFKVDFDFFHNLDLDDSSNLFLAKKTIVTDYSKFIVKLSNFPKRGIK